MLNNQQILLDMLSGDEKRILHASHTVINSGITNRKLLMELHPQLSDIKEKTRSLTDGGSLMPNDRFVEKAIRMIDESVGNKCLCEDLLDFFGQNGKSMVRYGFVLLEENMEGYIHRSIIECSSCHQRYEVEEEHTGWHATTTRCKKI